MKEGHEFSTEDGFHGSAGKNTRASVPGYKRGGHAKKVPQLETFPQGSNDDEMSMPSEPQMKKGGKVHGPDHFHGHHANHHAAPYGHHDGHHDTHPKHDHVNYDKDGFQHHKHHK